MTSLVLEVVFECGFLSVDGENVRHTVSFEALVVFGRLLES